MSATEPMPAVPTPGNVVGTFLITDRGTGRDRAELRTRFRPSRRDGPGGVVFDSATFGQVLWQISDQAGIDWDSTNASIDHSHIYASLRANYR